ncbi:methyl-accepting chemotaxis protein [Xanthobacter agilis]|uniref:Methyl-accepting chemotaxis protein n=1 Tax=Xanthobacter agilis TaxID=47492 RepID=A0ABU0LA95_XANAG|nr:methyl-accepting chemotaxis protein [Xanthobacter agilis]MDQ0504065.1 methyl-accepting chemotaxis protein [Xanthobacter agilis]
MSVVAFSRAARKDAAAQATQVLDNLPVAVLLCDPASFTVIYANARSLELLESLAHLLPVPPRSIVGAPLDMLFANHSARPRDLMADPAKLPLRLVLRLGDETIELKANVVRDRKGNYAQTEITWDVVSEEARNARRTEVLFHMLEDVPINVMTCSLDDFRIDYANRASRETLKRLEQHLPVKASEVIGASIDVFHKQPHMQHRLLKDSANLPHSALIHIGPEVLDLRMAAIHGDDGSYLRPMVTWSVATDRIKLADQVTEVVGAMTASSKEMEHSSDRLLELTENSERTSASVSSAAVEMSASFDEISRQISDMTGLSGDVAQMATGADHTVAGLSASMERIGQVTALIEKIAGQTNLLALNATIEAARVGEYGRGFAVVAQEVKTLAVQTASAIQDIRQLVSSVQQESQTAARAVSDISAKVRQLSEAFALISAGVEEQATTNRSVSQMISGVSDAASETRDAAMAVRRVAGSLGGFAETLNNEVASLLKK